MMSSHKEIFVHYHPQDGADWAKYLQSKLGEREYQIDIALNDVTSDDISQGKSKLNMFLITPDFLELIDLNILKGFDHQYSLAILMGVDAENLTFKTTQHGVHEDVKDWVTLDVEGSDESVRHLIMTIVTMYEYVYPPPRIPPVFREAIDEGMKVYVGLEEKVESDVFIQFDGKDEELKATYTNRYFYSFSLTDEEAQLFSTFSVICKEHKIGEGQLKDLVPSPQQVSYPEGSLTAGHASDAIGGKQSKLRQLWELLEEETDPINLLCQCMGLRGSDREQLDRKLANKISASGFPEHLSLMDSHENSPQIQSDQKWPTLLHFAAEYNLVGFAEALLCYPALAGECKIRNLDGRTPDEIAHHSGHQELSEILRLFSHSMPRTVQVMQDPSLGEKDGRLDRRAADDYSATREVEGEQNDENIKDKSEDSGETMRRFKEDQDTYIKLHTDHGATEEILFVAYPTSKEEFQQSQLTEERKAVENISHQQFNIRLLQENLKPDEKKKGFLSRLFKRKDKTRKRSVSDGVLDSVRDFQNKNRDMNGVHEDTKAKSKKKIHIFFRSAETRKSLRLSHAMRDNNISYPSLPSKKPGHPLD